MKLTAKSYPVLALLLSGGLLGGAYFFQYVLGYPPCQMCYWQRYVHMAVIVLAGLAIGAVKIYPHGRIPWNGLIILAFLISAGVAFWHVGVEYKWWEGPKTCAGGNVDLDFSSEDLLGSLGDKIKPPSCSEAVWHFLGLSMAAWNVLASLFGAVIGVLAVRKKNA